MTICDRGRESKISNKSVTSFMEGPLVGKKGVRFWVEDVFSKSEYKIFGERIWFKNNSTLTFSFLSLGLLY